MHDHGQNPEIDKDLLEQLGYEGRDVQVDWRIGSSAVLFFISVFVAIGVAWSMIGLVDRTQHAAPAADRMARPMMPPKNAPLLQTDVTAKKDMEELRAQEHKMMESSGWMKEDAGFARMPVDQAMEVVAKRGLPTRANARDPEEVK